MALCEDCKKNQVPSYRKKYCDECAERRKAEYEASKTEKPQQNAPTAQIGYTGGAQTVMHTFQNSLEFGPAGNRHKIYWSTIEELKEKKQALENEGFIIEQP